MQKLTIPVTETTSRRWRGASTLHFHAGERKAARKQKLKEKQRAFSDAEQYYTKSLEIRRLLPEGDDRGKSREQSIAQSLTSIGKLFLAMSDEEKVDSDAGRKSRQNFLAKALESLKAAKDAYTKGFHDGHPKVAWALEGLANVLEKSGDLRGAQGAWSEAIAIRRNLQLKDNKKEMFTKEMKEDEEKMKAIEAERERERAWMREQEEKRDGAREREISKRAERERTRLKRHVLHGLFSSASLLKV